MRLSMRPSFALPSLAVRLPRSNALMSADVVRLSWSRSVAESISALSGTALTLLAGMDPLAIVVSLRCRNSAFQGLFTAVRANVHRFVAVNSFEAPRALMLGRPRPAVRVRRALNERISVEQN